MASSAYGTVQDVQLYLRDVLTAPNNQIMTFLLSAVSRWVDNQMGQYFYSDGFETKWLDGGSYVQQGNEIDTGQHPFYAKIGNIAACVAGATSLTYTPFRGPVPNNGDALTLDVANSQEQVTVNAAPTNNGDGTWGLTLAAPGTRFAHVAKTSTTTLQVQLAYFENQPTANWITNLSGDGVRPPSNYFCWPRNPRNADSSSDPTQRRPWYGIDIAHIPISNTTYLPTPITGYATIAIAAHWGWPVVPDPIKDFTVRWTVKMWRSRESGWAESIGNAETGLVHEFLRLNAMDEATVLAHDYKLVHL